MAVVPDVQLVVQTILFLSTVGTGLVVSIPTVLTDDNFGGHCILYGDITWKNATYFTYTFGSKHTCNFVIYVNVIGSILYGFGMMIYFAYGVYKSRKDATIGSQMWVMPFMLSNCLVTVLSFIAACILSVGFGIWCQGFTGGSDQTGYDLSCSDGQKKTWNWNKGSKTNYTTDTYFHYLSAAQAAAWIGCAIWLTQLGLTIVRFIRNRRLRSKDSGFPDDVGTSDKREIAKEDPTA